MYTPDRHQDTSRHTETEYETLRRWGISHWRNIPVVQQGGARVGWFLAGTLIGLWFGVWIAT